MNITVSVINNPQKNISEDIKVRCTSDVVKIKEVQAIKNAMREHLLFIGLDNKNNVRHISLLGIGTSHNVIIDTKEIIRLALFSASDKVILVHNHPSNSLEPSKDDLNFTNVTNGILKVFNIKLLDHIIVTEKEYVSMEKIQKVSNNSELEIIDNMEKGLLLEENKRLKQQIEELQKINEIFKANDENEELNTKDFKDENEL